MPTETHFTKYLTSAPQNCQGLKNEENEKLSQPRGAKGDNNKSM